jgi:hypothetical protein
METVQMIRSLAVVAVCFAVGACQHSATDGPEPSGSLSQAPIDVRVDQAFALRYGGTANLTDGSLSVRFDAVGEDSRCPTDVQCVWAGNGRISLAVQGAGASRNVSLNTTLDPHSADVAGYRITLDSLAPAPVSTRTIEAKDYTAYLVISR